MTRPQRRGADPRSLYLPAAPRCRAAPGSRFPLTKTVPDRPQRRSPRSPSGPSTLRWYTETTSTTSSRLSYSPMITWWSPTRRTVFTRPEAGTSRRRCSPRFASAPLRGYPASSSGAGPSPRFPAVQPPDPHRDGSPPPEARRLPARPHPRRPPDGWARVVRSRAGRRARSPRLATSARIVGSCSLGSIICGVYGPGPACQDDVPPLPEGCACLSSIVRKSSPCWTSMR